MVNANNREFQDEDQSIKSKSDIIGTLEVLFLLMYFCSTIGRKRKQDFVLKLVYYHCPLCSSQYAPNGVSFFFFLIFSLNTKNLSTTNIFLKLHQIRSKLVPHFAH